MNPTSIEDFYSTNRSYEKMVIGPSGELVTVDPYEIAFEYDPVTGNRIGMSIDPPSTNFFKSSENFTNGFGTNAFVNPVSVAGSPWSLLFVSSCVQRYLDVELEDFNGDAVAISFFAKTSDGEAPIVGYDDYSGSDFTFSVNDEYLVFSTVDSEILGPMADGSFRIRVLIPYEEQVNKVSIIKPRGSRKSIQISRLQIEENTFSSYIPTNGERVSREGETISVDLVHGENFNRNQGTLEVIFIPAFGTSGCAATMRSRDSLAYAGIGRPIEDELARIVSPSNFLDNPLRAHYSKESKKKDVMSTRLSYSGYGAKCYEEGEEAVKHLKDHDFLKSGFFRKLQFGATPNGEHFSGHILCVRYMARSLSDEEMMNVPFGENNE